jgi:hypothetical protein
MPNGAAILKCEPVERGFTVRRPEAVLLEYPGSERSGRPGRLVWIVAVLTYRTDPCGIAEGWMTKKASGQQGRVRLGHRY